jgi:nucleoside-diphosphate-sugar epimerase
MIAKSDHILVTGGTGFVGSYIVRELLKRKYTNVSVLIRDTSDLSLLDNVREKLTFVKGDILNVPILSEILPTFNHIIHAAALVTFNPRENNHMTKVAVEGTANLVNLSIEYGLNSFVHISSIAAIGRLKDNQDIDETYTWKKSKFNTYYAVTKFLAEQEVWRGFAEGLNTTILNPSLVLGAGFWNSSSVKLFNSVKKGIPYYPAGGNGFVDVRDVAIGAVNGLEKQIFGERFILSSENISYQNVFQAIAENLNVKSPNSQLSPFLGNLAWRVEKLRSFITQKEPLLTKESYLSTSINVYYDNKKSIEMLDMRYRKINETIKETVECLMDSRAEYGILPL